MSEQSTPWPTGTVARYLTVGGSTVDITEVHPSDEEPSTIATCLGCDWINWNTWDLTNLYRNSLAPMDALAATRKAAQAHAETCRAMPNPGGAA